MTKKQSVISAKKDTDLRLIRRKLEAIIKSEDSTPKSIIDASRLLARMHHALQPDKVVEKAKDGGKVMEKPELKPEHIKKLNGLLKTELEQVRH